MMPACFLASLRAVGVARFRRWRIVALRQRTAHNGINEVTMIKTGLDELREPLRQQLASVGDEESIVIEDENGQPRYGIEG